MDRGDLNLRYGEVRCELVRMLDWIDGFYGVLVVLFLTMVRGGFDVI